MKADGWVTIQIDTWPDLWDDHTRMSIALSTDDQTISCGLDKSQLETLIEWLTKAKEELDETR